MMLSTHGTTVLFVDLDGTFLWDDEDDPTRITRLKRLQARSRVVFASSRPAAELGPILDRYRFQGDFIAENGAVTVTRHAAIAAALGGCLVDDFRPGQVIRNGPHADALCLLVASTIVPTLDRSAADVLDRATIEAGRLGRLASIRIPVEAESSLTGRLALQTLRDTGLNVVNGGRWITISGGPDKGRAATAYLAALGQARTGPLVMAAVGNADNDEQLLAAANLKWAFPDAEGHYATALVRLEGVTLLPAAPAEGWNRIERGIHY